MTVAPIGRINTHAWTNRFFSSTNVVSRSQIRPSNQTPSEYSFPVLLSKRENRKNVHEGIIEYLSSNQESPLPHSVIGERTLSKDCLWQHFEALCLSRAAGNVMDFWEEKGKAYYSIGSEGHESAGLVARALRKDDPFAPHYRDNQVLIERALISGYEGIEYDLIRGYFCTRDDPNGGRHKLLANENLHMLANTPTIGPKYPQMVGLAISFHLPKLLGVVGRYQKDAICVVSGGDGTIDQPAVLSAFNLASHYEKRQIPVPILFLIENNGIAISERAREGETNESLQRWGFSCYEADSSNPFQVFREAEKAIREVRTQKKPVFFNLKTYRLFGHSANPRNENYSPSELKTIAKSDPLLSAAEHLNQSGWATKQQCLKQYMSAHEHVTKIAEEVSKEKKLESSAQIAMPLQSRSTPRSTLFRPAGDKPRNMRQLLTKTYEEILEEHPNTLFFGQDISPGHYGVGMGLKEKFKHQVHGFPIDEVGLVAFGNGLSLNGLIPIIEISYKAYQLEGALSQYNEALLLRFLNKKYPGSGFVLRMPAMGLVKGGPTHTENAFLERMFPGAKVFCAGSGRSAVLCARAAFSMAQHGMPVISNEPTALYFKKDLFENDGRWEVSAPSSDMKFEYGDVLGYRLLKNGDIEFIEADETQKLQPEPLRILTYGNGVRMALRASKAIKQKYGKSCTVIEYPSLFPSQALKQAVKGAEKILIVDESRPIGCPGESILRELIQDKFPGNISIVTSDATYNPSGPAQNIVYLSEEKIVSSVDGMFW